MTVRLSLVERRDASYDILIGRDLLGDLPALLARACPAARYAVITDSHVAELYGKTTVARLHDASVQADLFTFPAGEWNKTRDTWAALTDRLLAAHVGRDAAIIALGGGVVGDVAGFVAATHLRGVPYVQIPTTLLAMIDSSIGGKTGVDVPAGKNLVGSFHQPRLVVADVDVLATLPAVQLAAGMAEALKHGIVADAAYFGFLEAEQRAVAAKDAAVLDRVVTRSVEIKADVVGRDERETGTRAVLNFGHTVAHAIEAVAKYEVPHGEAVAIGMAHEARLAETLGIAAAGTAQRVVAALERYGLPLDLPTAATVDDLLAAMHQDKKARGRGGEVRFALPKRVGEMQGGGSGWTVAVPEQAVRELLAGK